MGKIPFAGPHTEGRTLRRADYLGGDVLLPAVQRTVTNYLNPGGIRGGAQRTTRRLRCGNRRRAGLRNIQVGLKLQF